MYIQPELTISVRPSRLTSMANSLLSSVSGPLIRRRRGSLVLGPVGSLVPVAAAGDVELPVAVDVQDRVALAERPEPVAMALGVVHRAVDLHRHEDRLGRTEPGRSHRPHRNQQAAEVLHGPIPLVSGGIRAAQSRHNPAYVNLAERRPRVNEMGDSCLGATFRRVPLLRKQGIVRVAVGVPLLRRSSESPGLPALLLRSSGTRQMPVSVNHHTSSGGDRTLFLADVLPLPAGGVFGHDFQQCLSFDRLGQVIVAAGVEALWRSSLMAWAVSATIGPV